MTESSLASVPWLSLGTTAVAASELCGKFLNDRVCHASPAASLPVMWRMRRRSVRLTRIEVHASRGEGGSDLVLSWGGTCGHRGRVYVQRFAQLRDFDPKRTFVYI